MKTKLKNKIETFLKSLNIDNLDIMDYIDIENIDFENPFQSIYDLIDSNGGFDIEIIYYSNAIQYLKENDPSLRFSLEIASEFISDISSLNSEVLASLHASNRVREDFSGFENEIENFFADIKQD
jgi:hypothetical protein